MPGLPGAGLAGATGASGLGFWGFALVTALGYLAGALLGSASTAPRQLVHLPAWSRRRLHRHS